MAAAEQPAAVVAALGPESHVECSGLTLEAANGRGFALRDLSLTLERGALRPLLGPAASGKSVLLRVLAGLVRPQAGSVRVDGLDLSLGSDAELREFRRESVGLVGGEDLTPRLSVAANIELPLRLAGVPAGRARRRAADLITLAGLEELARVRAERLPPLAAARAAVAAAVAHEPGLLLLDEPTAALHLDEREELVDLLRILHRDLRLTLLLATRDASLARRLGGELRMRDGRIVSELVRRSAFSRGEGERVDELAVLDHDGRVELSPEQRRELGIGRRARVTIEDDHIAVWPERPPPDTRPPWRRR